MQELTCIHFSSQRLIDVWNSLTQAAIDANSVLAFETLLGIHTCMLHYWGSISHWLSPLRPLFHVRKIEIHADKYRKVKLIRL